MSDPQRHSVGLALGRLRSAVAVCCWICVLALSFQIVVWAAVNYTDVRFRTLEGGGDVPLIVEGTSPREQTMKTIAVHEDDAAATRAPADTNRVLSQWDRVMASAAALTRGAGLLAMLAVIPMIAMGVLLGAGSNTPGVESTVSSFTWATLTALLILPVGAVVDLPWHEGGLVSYGLMAQATTAGNGVAINLARFLALPVACMAGLAMVAFRFSAGVKAGMLPRVSQRLDPELEKEAAGITPCSLMGGRMAGALSQTVAPAEPPEGTAGGSQLPRAREVSQGEAPKRLI